MESFSYTPKQFRRITFRHDETDQNLTVMIQPASTNLTVNRMSTDASYSLQSYLAWPLRVTPEDVVTL